MKTPPRDRRYLLLKQSPLNIVDSSEHFLLQFADGVQVCSLPDLRQEQSRAQLVPVASVVLLARHQPSLQGALHATQLVRHVIDLLED